MKIKEGDIVKFLNDVGGGKVTKIIDKETAMVLNDTGFEIPVLIDELMPEIQNIKYESAPEKPFAEPEKNVFEEEPIYTNSSDVNFYLSFVPTNQKEITDCDTEIFLINDSNYFVLYNFLVKEKDKFSSLTGKIEPNVKERIGISEIKKLDDNTEVVVQLVYYKKGLYELREPVNKYIKISSAKFFKENSFKENDFFDEKAMVFNVVEENELTRSVMNLKSDEINEIKKNKENISKNRPKEFKKKENRYLKEVDLHVHELVDDESGMTDFDKLQYQLDVFHKEMTEAIKQNFKRIVFIHGVETGSLKLKLRNELQHKYKKYKFQDASFKEYGYGATMVLLRN